MKKGAILPLPEVFRLTTWTDRVAPGQQDEN